MALKIAEFFGYAPLDPAAATFVAQRRCPFIGDDCIKPNHGACSVQSPSSDAPIICCPNRLYAADFEILDEIATAAFEGEHELVTPAKARKRKSQGNLTGDEVAVFGRYWGQELPLPRPPGAKGTEKRKYYVDFILAKLRQDGKLAEATAVEVQTIDTTGSYRDQANAFFAGKKYKRGGSDYSNAGMNWENVNKRILPQVIYKGHVLRREGKAKKGMFFVCPRQVYDRIRDRLGGTLHDYEPGNGTITFRSYELGPAVAAGQQRKLKLHGQFTTTIDQIALAFTSPMNLPEKNVYEAAIKAALA